MSNEVKITLKTLCEETNSSVEMRLNAIDKVIHGFKKNNVELTVPNVVGALKASGVNISASSLYNKTIRGKPNPYRVLFDAWSHNIDKEKLAKVSHKCSPVDFTTMTDSDFASIGSDVVKFKVQTLYNELKSARHQINMLKQIQNLPVINDSDLTSVFPKHGNSSKSVSFEQGYEVVSDQNVEVYAEAISQFLSGNRKLEFDEDGCLVAKMTIRKGDILSDLDFRDVMEAALKALQFK